MSHDKKDLALSAIKASQGTEQGEYGIDLFISHHLEQFDSTEWQELLGKAKPSTNEIVESLVYIDDYDGVYDFSLPNDVTGYVVSVSFDDAGNVDSISMES